MCFNVPFGCYNCILCAQVHSWEQVGASGVALLGSRVHWAVKWIFEWIFLILCTQQILNLLRKRKQNNRNFLRFIIFIRGGHCPYWLWEPKLKLHHCVFTREEGSWWNWFLPPPFCSMSWLIWKTNLKTSVWHLCLIQLLSFLWCRWLKLTINHVLNPYFHPLFFSYTFFRHRLWAESLVGIFIGHSVLWCWWY